MYRKPKEHLICFNADSMGGVNKRRKHYRRFNTISVRTMAHTRSFPCAGTTTKLKKSDRAEEAKKKLENIPEFRRWDKSFSRI